MLCERCKIREANIQYTEVFNGVKTDHHFCAQCARELDFGQYSSIFEGEFPFAEFLSALLGGETPSKRQEKYQQIVCPTCGTTYDEFVKNSCFGCADCYGVFDVLIHDNIKHIQGSDHHKGKIPAGRQADGEDAQQTADPSETGEQSVRSRIQLLERQLKDALRKEEYETAAWCRDQIRALKEGKENDV